MNREEALVLLGTNEENLKDRVDEILFESKNFVYRNPVVPKVYSSRIKKLKVKEEAINLLMDFVAAEKINFEFDFHDFIETIDGAVQAYRKYEAYNSKLKLELNRVDTISSVISVYEALLNLENNWLGYWGTIFNNKTEEDKDIRVSEWINTGKVISELIELKNKGISELTPEIIENTEYFKKDLKRIFKLRLAVS